MASKAVLTGTHFMNGDEACAEGALAAGCRFFGGYPITPATEVAERCCERLPEVGGRNSRIRAEGYTFDVGPTFLMMLFIQAFRYAGEPFFFNYAKQRDAKQIYALVLTWFVIFCVALGLLGSRLAGK